MKIQIGNKIVDVKWVRHHKERKKKKVVDTECVISYFSQSIEGKKTYAPVALGHAHQSPKDQYVRSVGRKISLTRAIKDFDKRERTKIWGMYWENCKC